jgi:ABC-2 type transport system permease protein
VLAELTRLRSRRLSWIAMVLVLVAVGLLQLAVHSAVRPNTPAEIADAQRYYQQELKDYRAHADEYAAEAKDCLAAGNPPDSCTANEPKLTNFMRTPTPFAEVADVTVLATMYLTALAALLLGASFIGAEFSSGAVGNWLTFVPQRGRVFAAKVVALLLGTGVAGALVAGADLGLAAAVTRAAGQPLAKVQDLVEAAGRGVVITLVAAVAGFGLALLTRHTIAAAGIVLGYLLVTIVIRGFAESVPALQRLRPWLPENNAEAFLRHGLHYQDYILTVTDQGAEPQAIERFISFGHSATYWATFAAVSLLVTLQVFRRRDVT